jgi:hypothetical protein
VKPKGGWPAGEQIRQVLRLNAPVVSSSGKPRRRKTSRSRRIVFAFTPASAAISLIDSPARVADRAFSNSHWR